MTKNKQSTIDGEITIKLGKKEIITTAWLATLHNMSLKKYIKQAIKNANRQNKKNKTLLADF